MAALPQELVSFIPQLLLQQREQEGVDERDGLQELHPIFPEPEPAALQSVLWTKPADVVYWIGGGAGLMQLIALYLLSKMLWQVRKQVLVLLKPWVQLLVVLAMLSFAAKLALQAASALPAIADLACRVRYFIIGYLHLSLIGFVSLFLLGMMVQLGLYRLGRYGKYGLVLLLGGFFSTELLMFLHGTLLWLQLPFIPSFNLLMFLFSIPMPIGLGLLFVSQLRLLYKTKIQKGKEMERIRNLDSNLQRQ